MDYRIRNSDRRREPSFTARRWRWVTAGALFVGCAAMSVPAAVSQDAAAALESARLTMSKWLETQQVISRERKEWQQGREILVGRVELVRKEVELLQGKVDEAAHNASELDVKKAEVIAQREELSAEIDALAQKLASMEQRVRDLRPTLPAPLAEKLQPLYQRIPEDAAKTNVSLAERFQNVLGILNEVNKATSDLSVAYEVRTLGDGKPSEVRALYVGLAQAYYVSANGEAGIGTPGTSGWQWQPRPQIASEVLQALDIMEGKHSPAFVSLPMRIQ